MTDALDFYDCYQYALNGATERIEATYAYSLTDAMLGQAGWYDVDPMVTRLRGLAARECEGVELSPSRVGGKRYGNAHMLATSLVIWHRGMHDNDPPPCGSMEWIP